ncbi:Uncharacterized protein Adt_35459 [Abeliophyllum distichum]|uniref:Uncharacterized protein n=1 Tax=Abeliophyllum distichum TaxID=126358 RepID=A0ABD1QES3_9LAMI
MASQHSATVILYFTTLFSLIVVTSFAYKCDARQLGQIKASQEDGFKEKVTSAPTEEYGGEKFIPFPFPFPPVPVFNNPSPLFPFPPPSGFSLLPPSSGFSLPPIFHFPPFPFPSFFPPPPPQI